MKSIDVIGMMKTAASIVPLEGDNKFLVRWGNNRETIIMVEEAAEQRVKSDECQSHAWRAKTTGFKFCPDCGNPLRR